MKANNKLSLVLIGFVSMFAFLSLACGSGTTSNTGSKAGSSSTSSQAQPVIYKQADVVDVSGTRQSITEVKELTSDNEFYQPSSGMRYLAVMVNIENISNKSQAYNPLYYKMMDKDGITYNEAYFADATPALSSGELQPTMKAKGYLVFEVPVGMATSNLEFQYSPIDFSSTQIIWDLN